MFLQKIFNCLNVFFLKHMKYILSGDAFIKIKNLGKLVKGKNHRERKYKILDVFQIAYITSSYT